MQGAAALEPGNTAQYQRYLGTLPIESTLADGGKSGIQLIQSQRQKLFQASGGRSGTPPTALRRPISAPSASASRHNTAANHHHEHSPFRQFQQQMRHSSLLDSPLDANDLLSHNRTNLSGL